MFKQPFLLFVIFLLSCNSDSTEIRSSKESISSPYLISANQLKDELNDENKLIIQVSPEDIYKNGHIPGAKQIWRPDYATKENGAISGLMASRTEMNKLLQSLGLKTNDTIILYDHKGNVDAARFAWILQYYGFDKYRLLNGGLKYWQSLDLTIDTTQIASSIDSSAFTLENTRREQTKAIADDIVTALKDPDVLLIDTREDYEFLGKAFQKNGKVFTHKKGAFDRGSIPGAIHLNWSQLADLNGDHRIKSLKDLEYDLEKRGVTKDKQIILYCQSGSRTSHTFFVLTKVLGFENVKNYDGSWIEWTYLNQSDPIKYPINKQTKQDSFDLHYNKLKAKYSG